MLAALGGKGNVLTNTVCMTRLRVTLANPQAVDFDRLNDVPSVLGTAVRGANGLEVVFGPRMIDSVYHAFVRLTGIEPTTDVLFPMSRQSSSLSVQINTKARPTPAAGVAAPATSDAEGREEAQSLASELDLLDDLFGGAEGEVVEEPREARLLILNGPNVNMLGIGSERAGADYSALLQACQGYAGEAGFAHCVSFQSNHVGDLVDQIQDAYCLFDAIVLNAGAYAATTAIAEALRLVGVPYALVHLDLDVAHPRFDAYRDAIRELAGRLGL